MSNIAQKLDFDSLTPFECLVLVPAGLSVNRCLKAAAKAGALGVVQPLPHEDAKAVLSAAQSAGCARWAVRVQSEETLEAVFAGSRDGLALVIVPADLAAHAHKMRDQAGAGNVRLLAETPIWDETTIAASAVCDGFVLRGHECAGAVSEQTTFVLLQQARRSSQHPLYALGGITPETAAAARVGGASGVVLSDEIMAMAATGITDPHLQKRIDGFSARDVMQLEDPLGGRYLRGFVKGDRQAAADLTDQMPRDAAATLASAAGFSWGAGDIAPGGLALALAAPMRARFGTLGRFVHAITKAVATLPQQAAEQSALAENSPFSRALGTRYPIIQGPMTRVSDVSDFFLKVADAGALPMAALAMMKGPEAAALLDQTAEELGDKPWGVGLLGFAGKAVLDPQFAAIDAQRPDFAIVAGGRSDQIEWLESRGIRGFVHVAAAWQIGDFLDQGVSRFVIEGRECGGHIGPLTSFVLWGMIVDALLHHPTVARQPGKIELVFAGGIHDACSAAMVATLAAPLAEKGVKIGVLMGTAYLFTREIVEAGAILPDYQNVALDCDSTQTLWEGGGYASRCAITPVTAEFQARKQALEAEGASATEIREALERYTLGRLRMATKGVARQGPDKVLGPVEQDQRRREGMYMIGQVAAMRDTTVSIADLHVEVSAGGGDILADLRVSASARPARAAAPKPCDIALVGMATLLPGADTVSAYWRRILSGQSAIRDVPADRWSKIGYFDEDPTARDRIYATRGGFLEDVAFDPLKYGIPPTSIPAVDPMQLLALEVVADALDDAACGAREPLERDRTSVVFGFSGGLGEAGSQYAARSELRRLFGDVPEDVLTRLPEWTEDSFAGLLPNVASGRVANRFDFGGTNQTVDAACASSLAAVYCGVMELESGRADAVIAGGIDTLQSPFGYLCFAKTTALSPRGVCNTFDAHADGIAISEGLAAVVLKRLTDAERDGDRIYAVIKGVGASSDGRAKGLTAPLPAGQKRALGRAYEQAEFALADVQLLEAHGTGTVAGDRAEIETVTEMLTASGAATRSVAIGSVKTLIGHTKAAAGVAGLIKVALGLHHRVFPPHALVTTPNAALAAENTPLYLSQKPRPWVVRDGTPRRAGVSAFGFGGTNFHVALEEYADAPATAADPGLDMALFAAAGPDRAALADRLVRIRGAMRANGSNLSETAQTAALDSGDGLMRLAFVTGAVDDAAAQIDAAVAFLRGESDALPAGVAFSETPPLLSGGKLAFLYSGQGSQYPDMLAGAAMMSPEVMGALCRADRVFADTPTGACAQRDLSRLIYPGDAFDPATRKAQMAALTATEIAQPALGTVEAGLTDWLARLGVTPDMVAGHSYGEFAALYAAGVLEFDDLIRVSEARGRAMVDNGDPDRPGGMLAVVADADTTNAALGDLDVVIANRNSPRQTVIAGSVAAINNALTTLEAAGLNVMRVPVSQAFHSPLMQGARQQFAAALDSVPFGPARCPVYANVTARPHDPNALDTLRTTMADHLTSPVDFVAMLQNMAEDAAQVFVEIGPKSVLTSRVSEILEDTPHHAIALDRRSDGPEALLQALAVLYVQGAQVDLHAVARGLASPKPRPQTTDSPMLWYLNGAYARRADAERRNIDPPTTPVVEAPTGLQSKELQFMEVKPDGFFPPPPQTDGSGTVLAEYHRMMAEFLRVQERVMLAYLGQDGAARPAAAPALHIDPQPVPMPRPVQTMPVSPAAAPAAPEPVKPEAAPTPPAAPPAPDAAEMDAAAMTALFIDVIADKTGYPAETLDAGQAMEADLGVDSIKRMEILSAVQKVLPDHLAQAMRGEIAQITGLPSVQEIVNHVFVTLDGAADPAAKEAANPFDLAWEAETTASAVLPRFVQNGFEEPADHVPDDLPANSLILVTPSGDGFHDSLCAALAQRGLDSVLMPEAVLRASDPVTLAEWVAAQNPGNRPLAIVHTAPRAAMPAAALTEFQAWTAAHERGSKTLFRLLQAVAPQLRAGGRMVVAMATGGAFGRQTEADGAEGLSIAPGALGLVKALSLEWPDANLKVVDLDPVEPPAQQAEHLLAELCMRLGRREVGYPSGRRTILRTEPAALAPPQTPPDLPDADWVIVATGGARGITAECLRSLAPFAPTLVLIGRSPRPEREAAELQGLDPAGLRKHFLRAAQTVGETPKPAEIEARIAAHLGRRDMAQNIADFEAMGARVDYRAADVGDPAAVQALFADLMVQYGRIDMVVHGAGVIEDTAFEKKTAASFDRVFDTKVQSAFLVTEAARNSALKAVCFFSSVAGRYGNPGQADYAAANEVLNRYAWALKRGPLAQVRVKTINWGPWGQTTTGAGMVTEALRAQFLSRGIGMVEAVPGRDYFFKEMFWAPETEVESCGWVADAESLEAAACALPPAPEQRPLPGPACLLRTARLAADNDQALDWRFDIVSAPYTDDHRFDGQPVLPMACAMQMMAELPVALDQGQRVVAVENLRLFKGLTLEENSLPLRLELSGDGPRRAAKILSDGEVPRPHYQAELVLDDALPNATPYALPGDPALWEGVPITEIYRSWLSHGPRFQVLDKLEALDATGLRLQAHATRPDGFVPVPGDVTWDFDPGLVDGMVQTLWIWSRALHDMSALPLSIQALRRFAGDSYAGPLRIVTHIREMQDNGEILSDIRAWDAHGVLCYAIEGFRAQATPALNRLGGGWSGGARPVSPTARLDAAE